MKIVSGGEFNRFATSSFQFRHDPGQPSMNEGTIRRRIVDYMDSWKIAQQLSDTTDVLRITVGKHQSSETVHAGPVQILAHDAFVSAFASAIDQPVLAIRPDVNGCARAQVQHCCVC